MTNYYVKTRTSCSCGGKWAWVKVRHSGACEMYGCICHNKLPAHVVVLPEVTYDFLRALDLAYPPMIILRGQAHANFLEYS